MKKINMILPLVLTVALVASCNLGKLGNSSTKPENTKTLGAKTDKNETTLNEAAPEQDEVETGEDGLVEDAEEAVGAMDEIAQADDREAVEEAKEADNEKVAGRGENAEATGNVKTADAVKAEGEAGKADDENQARKVEEDAKKAAEAAKVEAEKAFRVLSTKINNYKKLMERSKTRFDSASSETSVAIPAEVKAKGFKDEDQPKIHASLGYSNTVNQDLNKAIKTLSIGSGKDEEIKVVSDVFKILVGLEDATRKIFDELVTEDILGRIKSDKSKIDELGRIFDSFAKPRTAFVRDVQRTIKTAATKNDATGVREELKKIIELATKPWVYSIGTSG
ncbi:hypothetical protein [Borrelia sp. RT1S]|uniref:hypothetical protein n=1 Tax=Borrelia sp. RT1S TaxID=2898580 RepID=UPI001E489453|nr:hypothetical protein [Borrelia sp. RT1S]UGQ17969.1 hypothetical protein LSO05_05915 [Borrelia sp. RT1S]